jgi:hypothetical protein
LSWFSFLGDRIPHLLNKLQALSSNSSIEKIIKANLYNQEAEAKGS